MAMRFVVIPVKELSRAKERLSTLLEPQERMRLAAAMLGDVLRAVSESTAADRSFVVTLDAEAMRIARSYGIEVLKEDSQTSESASIDWASRRCAALGADAVLRIPGDVPLVTARDIDDLLRSPLKPPGVVLVPSLDGLGTNAVLKSPPTALPSRFGHDSLRRHLEDARTLNLSCEVRAVANLALDIDDTADLKELLRRYGAGQSRDSHTWRALYEAGIVDKVRRHA